MSTSIIERTRAALRRLGTPACQKCGRLMPSISGRTCDDCLMAATREKLALERDLLALRNIVDATTRSSSPQYLRAVGEYGHLIEEAMGDWQIGNGIFGAPRD